MKKFLLGASLLALAACGGDDTAPETTEPMDESTEMMGDANEPAAIEAEADVVATGDLQAILDAQPEEVQARYQYRHPKETLEFFGIEPGMTVVEILPGGGWYSQILIPYLGADGMLVGADYSMEMWPLFGGFATEEWMETRRTWPETWSETAEEWRGDGSAPVMAYEMGNPPAELEGQVDAILAVRAFHHFNRFEDDGGFRTAAIDEFMWLLKPGGVVGIVQHRAQEDKNDEWAAGDNGYVKQSAVVEAMESAGFELVAESDVNANPNDRPTDDEVVWRLPPTLGSSGEDEELRAQMMEIGESDRMTLLFRKPA